jgi:hypothetical protein
MRAFGWAQAESHALPLMSRQELRAVWLTRAEVEANLESREAF